jgi:Ser/Thr protein kinase RdoA (MazF antagonist)
LFAYQSDALCQTRGVTASGEVIRAAVEHWGAVDLPLERAVFGTADPDGVAAAVDAWCRVHLGAPVAAYVFFDSSSGSVHGVRLADARAVVVKVHRPGVSRAYLDALHAAQLAMVELGYPAPRPLVRAVPAPPGHVTAAEMLGPFPKADAHDPSVRRALARGLASFVAIAARVPHDGLEHPMAVADGALYPSPHSARFDFAATAAGAEWIDDLARRARTRRAELDAGPPVLVHGDWRIDNARVARGEVVAVYDWDSVGMQPEAIALASAALTFSVDWDRPAGLHFPSPAEIADFVSDYEAARGEPFAPGARAALAAAMVASLAYGARCEHADAATRHDTPDSFTGLLRLLGNALLDEGLDALRWGDKGHR